MKHTTRTQCQDTVFKCYNMWHTELPLGYKQLKMCEQRLVAYVLSQTTLQ